MISPAGQVKEYQLSSDYSPISVNAEGEVAGTNYAPVPAGEHSFLVSPQGTITLFDAPGAAYTDAVAINDLGVVTGWYQTSNTPATLIGFLRISY